MTDACEFGFFNSSVTPDHIGEKAAQGSQISALDLQMCTGTNFHISVGSSLHLGTAQTIPDDAVTCATHNVTFVNTSD